MTHRCRKKLKKPTHEFLMILNQLVPFLKKTWKKSWKNLKKSFVIILQPSQFSILFFLKSKIPLKLCWNTKNHGFNPTWSDCNWPWHLMKLCWSHGKNHSSAPVLKKIWNGEAPKRRPKYWGFSNDFDIIWRFWVLIFDWSRNFCMISGFDSGSQPTQVFNSFVLIIFVTS